MPSRRFQIQRNQTLYCRKPVQFGTKSYEVGDVFPYKKLEASWKRVVVMFSAMTLIGENDVCFEDVMEQKNIRLGISKPVVEEPEETKPVATIFNRGRGWYDVLVDGAKINKKALKKVEAKRIAEDYNNV